MNMIILKTILLLFALIATGISVPKCYIWISRMIDRENFKKNYSTEEDKKSIKSCNREALVATLLWVLFYLVTQLN